MSDRLSILHLAHVRWFNAEAQYALDLALEMRRQGHRVGFLAETASPAAAKAKEAGLQVFEEDGFGKKGAGSFSVLAAGHRLKLLLRSGGFDAVECHRPEGLPLIALACRLAAVPLVRVRGDMRPARRDPFNRWLHRRLLAAVVASNTAVEARLRERLGPLPRLMTIHGGVDPERFTPEGPAAAVREDLGLPAHAFLVGILGRLGSVKGHGDFLAAAREVLDAPTEAAFVVLAKEPSAREAELRAEVDGDPLLRGRVGFLGHCPDLPAVLRAFDLGVVASTGSEANCRVGLEWMASGVALLATRVGVLPDLVAEGETGHLVAPGRPEALAEKIAALSARPSEARRLGAAARRRVLDRFTLARCAEAHAALLGSLRTGARP
ncbi:MAG: glycosyltransferase family 4 protein [Deltaproteobacteria bacterium]|nr:glycosyltransferase family 4 protein [Deltaproteobacteria bacterium]